MRGACRFVLPFQPVVFISRFFFPGPAMTKPAVSAAPETIDIGQGLQVSLFAADSAARVPPEGLGAGGPEGSEKDRPVAILAWHGGGGVDGAPDMLAPFCRLLSAGGADVVAAGYRTLNRDGATLEQMRADAAHALSWARNWAGGQQPEARLFLLGASFGGLLALDAALEDDTGIAGLILLNPVTDTGPGGFANRVVDPAVHAALSPRARLADGKTSDESRHPLLSRLRCFIAHGGRDEVVPIAAAREFAGLWPAGRCVIKEYPNAGHGFFNRPPHDENVARLVLAFIREEASVVTTPAAGKSPEKPRKASSLLPAGATLVFGIGAQKAGTSWLFEQLRASPDCHTVATKELHYFDALYVKGEQSHIRDRVAHLRRKIEALTPGPDPINRKRLLAIQVLADRLLIHATAPGDHRAYVDHLLNGYAGQKIICDFTPSYSVLPPEAFAEMAGIGPARFIFILRDPIDRIWSQIRMEISTAQPRLADAAFETACAARAAEMHGGRDLARIPRANYAGTLEALDQSVPSGSVHTVFYEDLFTQASMDEVCAFLDIAPLPVEADKRVGLGRVSSLPPETEALLFAGLRPQYEAAFERFGAAVPSAWHSRYAALCGETVPVVAPTTAPDLPRRAASRLVDLLKGRGK
jgi:pimeloyl-ACP methyl ester carboxylesterase